MYVFFYFLSIIKAIENISVSFPTFQGEDVVIFQMLLQKAIAQEKTSKWNNATPLTAVSFHKRRNYAFKIVCPFSGYRV